MSIAGENYERSIIPVRSGISGFSRGTVGSEVPYSLKQLHAVLNQFAVYVGDVLLELGVSCGILTRNGKSVVLNQEMSDEMRESIAAEAPHALHGLETLGPFVRDMVVEHVRARLLLRSPQDDDLSPMLGNLVFSILEGSEAYQSLRTIIKKLHPQSVDPQGHISR